MDILRTYYLYCLIDPDLKIPRYIGISINPDRRFKDHLKDKAITSKTLWINSLKQGGKSPIMKIIKKTNDVNQIKIWEMKAIAKYKDIYSLTNSTKGGELDCEGTPIEEYDMEGKYLDSYSSMTEYCNLHGWPETWATCISAVCLRKRNYTHNRMFRYIDDSVTKEDLENLNKNLHRTDPVSFIIMNINGEILGKFESFQDAHRKGFGSPTALAYSLKGTPGFGSVNNNLICYNEADFEHKLHLYRIAKAGGKETVISKYDLDGNYIETFYSYSDASKSVNSKNLSPIKDCCKGIINQYKNFQWKFGESKENIGKYIKPSNRGKTVSQYSLSGDFIKKWPSVRKASIELNIDAVGIRKCAEGLYNKSGGYKWKYD